MKQQIKTILKKCPILFYLAKMPFCVFWKLKIGFLELCKNPVNRKLYKIYDDFISLSGIKNAKYNLANIEEASLNTNYLDDKIEEAVLRFYNKNKRKFAKPSQELLSKNKKNIGILFTEIYSNGGHTPLIERFCGGFYKDYNLKLFCTRLQEVKYGDYSKKNTDLLSKIDIDGVCWNFQESDFSVLIIELYNKIISFNTGILFCYIHPNDIVIAATLALLKNNTNIQIIDLNIQDHCHNLGFKFAHLLIDARPAGQRINIEVRGHKNTILMPLQQRKINETTYHTDEEKQKVREQLGINGDEYFTLTGCAYHKIFEESTSQYLKMIVDLLTIEPKLKHVLMLELTDECRLILQEEFKNNQDLLNRLIIIDRVSNFDIYMQACDLFIDSFPQGSALTHLDMMRNKRPTVLKINKENPVRSFEYYLPEDYQYQYDNTEDMKNGILKLLRSKDEQGKASQKLYQYYLDNYEFEIVKKKYQEIINGADNLEQFFGRSFYEGRAS